jgi:tRNA-specific 2-thiouridylase
MCTAAADYEDVKRVCNKLNIPYYSVNFAKDYMDRVFSYFLHEYSVGRTPNPDVLCNREIKFGPFLDYAKKLGADYIATGHYAKISHNNNKHILIKAVDLNKDQTYFLHQLSQKQLEHVLFPVGDMVKPDVRKIALKYGFSTAEKKDSTGICFIGERKFREFLKNYLPAQSGKIVDEKGNVVGTHEGIMFYTLGQRRGLNIGGLSTGNGGRWFVVDKDIKNNLLIVSQGNAEKLYSIGLIAKELNWIPSKPKQTEFECFAKFRYRQDDQKVKVKIENDKVIVNFFEKQRAVTPGQFVVFYGVIDENDNIGFGKQGDELCCLGGGAIDEIIKENMKDENNK